MIHAFGFVFTWAQVAAAIAGIGFLVFIHELGHFAMAKFYGIKVEQFAFGFGPEVCGFTYGETRYSLNAIPLGGMVKMPGEGAGDATGAPDEFLSQPWHRRFLLAAAGPVMNYALAVILFTVVIAGWGVPRASSDPVIGDIVEGYPAAAAGLLPGDRVVSVNRMTVTAWEALAAYIHKYPATPLVFTVDRAGKRHRFTVVPRADPSSGMGLIGIAPSVRTERFGVGEAVYVSARMVVYQSVFTLQYLGQKIARWEKPDLAGPIGVIQILAKAANAGWATLLHLLAVISVALGLFNVLPIPLVDGGHMTLALIEGISRRPVSKRVIAVANYAGLALIVVIFLFATYSDIMRLGAQ